MKPELRSIHSTSLPQAFVSMPTDIMDCWVDIAANIGAKGEKGGDIFVFQVATVSRIRTIVENNAFLAEPHIIVVERFDWETVEAAIQSILNDLEADTWDKLAILIHQFGEWEFHSY